VSVFKAIWKVVDVLLGVAIRADELRERRRARKKFRDVVDEPPKDSGRSRAPTVVIRRPPPH
jgi:hypothetical protein